MEFILEILEYGSNRNKHLIIRIECTQNEASLFTQNTNNLEINIPYFYCFIKRITSREQFLRNFTSDNCDLSGTFAFNITIKSALIKGEIGRLHIIGRRSIQKDALDRIISIFNIAAFLNFSNCAMVRFFRFLIFQNSVLENQANLSIYKISEPKALTPCSKDVSIPLIAALIRTTEVIPITIPIMVRTERTLFARIACKAMSKPSRNSNTITLIDRFIIV